MSAKLFKFDRFEGGFHAWFGPLGLHVYWPDVWKSRPDWCSSWRGDGGGA